MTTALALLLAVVSLLSQQQNSTEPPLESSAPPAYELSFGLRYRLESVDDDSLAAVPLTGKLDAALASTLRSQLRLDTRSWHGLSFHIAVEDVRTLGNDNYNNAGAGSLRNGQPGRAVVADPANTEISQGFVVFEPNDRVSLSAGRQELSFDQERFIGPVGWRQNHQEFDALHLAVKPTQRLTVRLGFIDRVHTITGAEQAAGHSLLNVLLALEHFKIGGYGYWLEYDSATLSRLSSGTLGLRSSGTFAEGAASFTIEIAEQQDNGNHPNDFSLGYRGATLGWSPHNAEGLKLEVGGEILEGDGTNAFRTPLATLHKFNGLADRFLVTPATGLKDLFATLSYRCLQWSGQLTYHRFEPEHGSGAMYGDEWDAVISYRPTKRLQFALKTALYQADGFSSDGTKAMVWTAWSF